MSDTRRLTFIIHFALTRKIIFPLLDVLCTITNYTIVHLPKCSCQKLIILPQKSQAFPYFNATAHVRRCRCKSRRNFSRSYFGNTNRSTNVTVHCTTCISRNATTEKFVTSEQRVNNTERWAGHLLQMSFVIPDRGPRRSLVVFPPVTKITEIIKYRTFIHINC